MSLFGSIAGEAKNVSSIDSGATAKRKQYQSLLDANPYRNVTYQKSPWQNFLSLLGFRTQADAWQENMNIQAREYDAAILQKEYDEQYNSPTEQAQRMQAAGLNPNLNGGQSIDSGSAAPLGDDPSTPMQTTGEEEVLHTFATGMMSCISDALGFVGAMQGVVRNHAQNTLSKAQAQEAIRSLSKGIFIDSLPDQPLIEGEDSIEDARSFALDRATNLIRKLPRSMRKKAQRYVESYWDSAPASKEAYNAWLGNVNNQKGYYKETGVFYDAVPEVMRDVYKEIGKMNEDIYKATQEAELEGASADYYENENRAVYAKNVNADLAAEATNQSNRSASTTNSINASIHSAMKRITNKLEQHSKSGGLEGMFATALLVIMSAQQMQMLPRMSISNGITPKGKNSSFSLGL